MTIAALDDRPPRGTLTNLVTGEEYQFLFNPQTIEETIEAKYNRTRVLGLSHERLQYQNTGNKTVPLELYISQLMQDKLSGQANSSPTLAQQKAWLESLVFPASSNDLGYVGPPNVLFIWPNVLRMTGRITSVKFLHRVFNSLTLKTVQLVATLAFEENLEERRLMEDVMLIGTQTQSEPSESGD